MKGLAVMGEAFFVFLNYPAARMAAIATDLGNVLIICVLTVIATVTLVATHRTSTTLVSATIIISHIISRVR